MMHDRRSLAVVAWLLVVTATAGLAGCVSHPAGVAPGGDHWVGAWEAAPQLVEPANLPPMPGLTETTLRQVIHLSLGGGRWRFRISNEFGNGPLTIGAARAARSVAADTIDVASEAPLTFDGAPSVTIPAGQAVLSDAVSIVAPALSAITLSLYLPSVPKGLTGHPGSRTTSYIGRGDQTGNRVLVDAAKTDHWYLMSGALVAAPGEAAAVIVLGNSIADGRGSGTNRNDRWPDNLARRLQADPSTANVSVLNAGIGGNAILHGGLGPTALDRLDRDVLRQPGARWLIVSEGVNDIGASRADSAAATAQHLIDAYGTIIRRARGAGLRVYGATMLPFGGSQYGSAAHEDVRRIVNAWIRDSGAFDGVIDLDAAMRDPSDASRLAATVDGGDHLHPNERGYQQMASAVDLRLFASASR
jgi:lysophospholipase L1-like esterase